MMPDREKVINELVEHIESALAVDSDYVDCVRTDLLQYTVAMLKEQEAVSVHDPGAYCPKCGWMLYPEDHPHHCGNCGQAVKWE